MQFSANSSLGKIPVNWKFYREFEDAVRQVEQKQMGETNNSVSLTLEAVETT